MGQITKRGLNKMVRKFTKNSKKFKVAKRDLQQNGML